PGNKQQERRYHADRRIARQNADQHSADGHQSNGDEQCGLASVGISDAPKKEAPEGAGHKAESISKEGCQQASDRIALRKEVLCYVDGNIGIDRKVVPFEHIADHRGGDGPPRLSCLPIHCSLPRAPEKAPFPATHWLGCCSGSVGRTLGARNRAANVASCPATRDGCTVFSRREIRPSTA